MIIIHGLPGSGKTTLAWRLVQDVGLRLIGQDAVKEAIADQLGRPVSAAQSSIIGRATRRAVLELGAEFAALGEQLIVEAALKTDEAEALLADLSTQPILQLYVACDMAELKRRFVARKGSMERHWVHADDMFEKMSEAEITRLYRPLQSAQVQTLPLTSPLDDTVYNQTINTVKQFIATTQKEEI
ncbi:MAG: AAA family ATPase [Candidatus Saccharibacteria bacterium]|nr:AAA family ATPase [Candidatus Saccharibacteria bacterium]